MRWRDEAVARHVADRGRHQRDRRLLRRGGHADPDLSRLRAARDAGAEPEDGAGVYRGEHSAFLRPAEAVRTMALTQNVPLTIIRVAKTFLLS